MKCLIKLQLVVAFFISVFILSNTVYAIGKGTDRTAGSDFIKSQPPKANAGADKLITLPVNSVTLTGTGTSIDGYIRSYLWSKLSGPSSGTITSPQSAQTTVTGLVNGSYLFVLKVTDNRGAAGKDTVKVTVNQPPKANAGADQSITLPVNSVTLTGSGTDADGKIISYAWSKVSGPSGSIIATPSSAKTTVSGLLQGTYLFKLIVKDNAGATAKDTVKVVVKPALIPVQPSGEDLCTRVLRVVVIGSSTAYGKGATPIDSAWAYKYAGYMKGKNSQSTFINLAVPGYTTYEVLCPTGFTPPSTRPAPDSLKNITQALSLHPDAILINLPTNDIARGFTLTEQKANYERAISLAAAQGVPLWVTTSQPRTNLNAGEKDSLKLLRDWTYTRFGTNALDFWSTVANSDGSINAFYDSGDGVHVNNAGHALFYERVVAKKILDAVCTTITANKAPIADAGLDQSITLPTNYTTLSGSGTDADGTIASYLWSKISGPSGSTLSSATSAKTTLGSLVQGTYYYKLTVKDNGGASDADTVKIVVKAATTTTTTTTTTKYIKVNIYGGSNAYSSTAWNNWNVGTGESTNISSGTLKYSDGTASSISAVLSHSQAVGDNGSTYASTVSSTMAPKEVLRYMSYSTQSRTLTISGLSPTKKYNVELYDSRYSTGNSTVVKVGGSSKTIDVYDNYTNKALFSSLTPSSSGQLVITIDKTANYSHLNGFMLVEQGSDYSTTAIASAEKVPVEAAGAAMSVFPNPVQDQMVLQLNNSSSGEMTIQLIDMKGVVVKQIIGTKTEGTYTRPISINDLKNGSYFIRVSTKTWSNQVKIIKQ